MAKAFNLYDYDDASELFGQKALKVGARTILAQTGVRRDEIAKAATQFFNGNHWQDGDGFIGQLPPRTLPGWQQITQDIKDAFVTENVIQEIVETHVGGILGREPLWSFLSGPDAPEEAVGELLTEWWNEREALNDLQRSAETVILEGRAVRRLYIPKGRLSENGEVPPQGDIPDALDFIFFENLHSDVAGVFTDPDTQFQIGIYLFEEKDDEGNVLANCAELSFLDKNGDTVCRVVKDRGADVEYGPYSLGGRLLLHELSRRPLVTEQVQSEQKALNLAHTMMMRNVNLAGARERSVVNAQPPRRPVRVQNPKDPGSVTTTEPGTYETGAGAVMFLMGFPIRNEKGDIIGYTNPNVSISDPAPVDTFVETRNHYYSAMLGQCHQRHVLIVDKAESSGRAREQARAEFERSLKETKTVIDAAGRWQLETSLRLAAQFSNQTATYIDLRADFNCLIDSGEVDPEKITTVISMRQPGGPRNEPLISDETARNLVGIDDAAAEKARIDEEAPTDADIKKRGERQQLLNPPAEPQEETVN